jgi:hypothetical protein
VRIADEKRVLPLEVRRLREGVVLPQGVTSPLAGQMFFRATLFGAFGGSKRWLGTNSDGSARALSTLDFYKAGAMTGFIAAFTEGPIDFYKSQIQYQIIKSKTDPTYKRTPPCSSVSAPMTPKCSELHPTPTLSHSRIPFTHD